MTGEGSGVVDAAPAEGDDAATSSLAMAGGVLLAVLSFSFVNMTENSDVIPPDDQEQIAEVLQDNAELVSTTQLEELLDEQPDEIADEITRINTDAGDLALRAAMLIPVLACLLGFANSFRMMRLPDFAPCESAEGVLRG